MKGKSVKAIRLAGSCSCGLTGGFFAIGLCLSASTAFAAGKFPNHNLMTRFIGADTNETYSGVVNDGTVYKLGTGAVTLSQPALTSGSDVKVTAGTLTLDYTGSQETPVLPESLSSRIRLWLDAGVNVAISTSGNDTLVDTWFDRREAAGVTTGTATYPYAQSGIQRIDADSDGNERRPNYVSSVAALGNRPCLDFGKSRTSADVRYLRFQNATTAADWVYAREIFIVFARRSDSSSEGGVTLLGGYFHTGSAAISQAGWAPNADYIFFSNENTRADKGQLRMDGESVWGGKYPMRDYGWHVMSMRLPLHDDNVKVNQIGLDRNLPAGSGGARIAEMILFESRLSDGDRLRVEDYLRRKWFGVTAGNIGTFAVSSTGRVEVATAGANLTMRVAGSGKVAVSGGTGAGALVGNGFTGAVELESGAVRQEDVPFSLSAGQQLAVNSSGFVTPSDVTAGVAVKSGSAELKVSSLGAGVSKLQVADGCLRLVSPAEPDEAAPQPAEFPNAGFEDFMSYCTSATTYFKNFAGSGGQCATNSNWVFDRSAYASGGALAIVLFKNAYHAPTWNVQIEDGLGLGYEGGAMAYLYQGSIAGFFTLPSAGRYRLSCRVSSRNNDGLLKCVPVLVDGVEVGKTSSFDTYAFKRWEISLPHLEAGKHEVRFADYDGAKILVFDDLKVVPESIETDEVAVAVANASFEEPISNFNGSKDPWYRPEAASLADWTATSVEPAIEFYKQAVTRSWYQAMTNSSCVGRGQSVYHEEFPDGFIAMQLYGNGSLTQDVAFPSAGRYRLRFSLAKRCGLSPQTVEVRVGGKLVKAVTVRNDAFCEYEAVFDIGEAGAKTLSFAGTVTNAKEYLVGSAYLDKIELYRIAESVSPNLVSNGGFENGTTGWTLENSAKTTSAVSAWVDGMSEPALQGTESIALHAGLGNNVVNAIEQSVTFSEPGRYLLSFRIRSRIKYPERNATAAHFSVAIGDETLQSGILLGSDDSERVVELPFAVAVVGAKTLRFATSSNTAGHETVLIDDVSIVKAPATAMVAEDVFGRDLEIEIASGAKLALDYDGTAHVKSVRLAGRKVSGLISAAQYPAYLSGRGMLYVQPRGTCVTFR